MCCICFHIEPQHSDHWVRCKNNRCQAAWCRSHVEDDYGHCFNDGTFLCDGCSQYERDPDLEKLDFCFNGRIDDYIVSDDHVDTDNDIKLNDNVSNKNKSNDNILNDNKLNDTNTTIIIDDNKLNENKSNDNTLNENKSNDNILNENKSKDNNINPPIPIDPINEFPPLRPSQRNKNTNINNNINKSPVNISNNQYKIPTPPLLPSAINNNNNINININNNNKITKIIPSLPSIFAEPPVLQIPVLNAGLFKGLNIYKFIIMQHPVYF